MSALEFKSPEEALAYTRGRLAKTASLAAFRRLAPTWLRMGGVPDPEGEVGRMVAGAPPRQDVSVPVGPAALAAFARARPNPPPVPAEGSGTELKEILRSLGFRPDSCGGCRDLAAEMDRGGPAWCREHKAEIVERLRAKRKEASWREKIVGHWKAVTTGLALELDPLDPLGSAVELAIRRWEAKQAAAPPNKG